jgi:hypothetical protein
MMAKVWSFFNIGGAPEESARHEIVLDDRLALPKWSVTSACSSPAPAVNERLRRRLSYPCRAAAVRPGEYGSTSRRRQAVCPSPRTQGDDNADDQG